MATQVKIEKKAGKPNLEKLLMPTKHHPHGRVQIDPETGLVRNPRNNVLYVKEKIIRHESGAEIGKLEIPVNGGHAHEPGSVWRTGLRGPKKYHEKVLKDDETYRLKAHRVLSSYAKRFGLTYATCYEYKYERDDNGNILSKTGISIGREFTTAPQCHGHKVPVYSRNSADEMFRPVDECPDTGCLYCASESDDGQPRCGDKIAGEGRALRFVDLKLPVSRDNE